MGLNSWRKTNLYANHIHNIIPQSINNINIQIRTRPNEQSKKPIQLRNISTRRHTNNNHNIIHYSTNTKYQKTKTTLQHPPNRIRHNRTTRYAPIHNTTTNKPTTLVHNRRNNPRTTNRNQKN